MVQEPKILSKTIHHLRKGSEPPASKYKGSKKDVGNFFENFTKLKSRSKSGDFKNLDHMPFHLLMSNFRRKFIMDTILDKTLSYEQKQEKL